MGRFTKATEKGILGIIKIYRYCLSPWIGQHCRFYPTCSQYAEQAILRFGALFGIYLTFKRLFKCHPWHLGGVDLVPLNKDKGKI